MTAFFSSLHFHAVLSSLPASLAQFNVVLSVLDAPYPLFPSEAEALMSSLAKTVGGTWTFQSQQPEFQGKNPVVLANSPSSPCKTAADYLVPAADQCDPSCQALQQAVGNGATVTPTTYSGSGVTCCSCNLQSSRRRLQGAGRRGMDAILAADGAGSFGNRHLLQSDGDLVGLWVFTTTDSSDEATTQAALNSAVTSGQLLQDWGVQATSMSVAFAGTGPYTFGSTPPTPSATPSPSPDPTPSPSPDPSAPPTPTPQTPIVVNFPPLAPLDPGSNPPTPSDNGGGSSSGGSSNSGAIIAGIVGGIVGLAVLCVIGMFVYEGYTKKKKEDAARRENWQRQRQQRLSARQSSRINWAPDSSEPVWSNSAAELAATPQAESNWKNMFGALRWIWGIACQRLLARAHDVEAFCDSGLL